MAPEFQAVVHATQAWLQSSWHIQVPFAWLEACVEWLQEEAGGTGHHSQQQINQQVGRVSDQLVVTHKICGGDELCLNSKRVSCIGCLQLFLTHGLVLLRCFQTVDVQQSLV